MLIRILKSRPHLNYQGYRVPPVSARATATTVHTDLRLKFKPIRAMNHK
jgi:hypothetical protein